MHGQGHPVGPVPFGRSPQGPQRILQTRAQTRETLAETERDMLPIGRGQDKVIEQVREGSTRDRHLQIVHRRKVRGPQPAREMLLREEHLLGRAMQGLPLPHAPFERAAHGVGILPRLRPLQPVPEGLGLQTRLLLQLLGHNRPDFRECVGPGPPGPRLAGFMRQLAELAILAG